MNFNQVQILHLSWPLIKWMKNDERSVITEHSCAAAMSFAQPLLLEQSTTLLFSLVFLDFLYFVDIKTI